MGGAVSTQIARPIAGSARNALYVSSLKSSQCQGGDRLTQPVFDLSLIWPLIDRAAEENFDIRKRQCDGISAP
jgi:hypothetical protein